MPSSLNYQCAITDRGLRQGQHYFEMLLQNLSVSSNPDYTIGLANNIDHSLNVANLGKSSRQVGFNIDSSVFDINGVETAAGFTFTYNQSGGGPTTTLMRVAVNFDRQLIWIGNTSSWLNGDPATGTGGQYFNNAGLVMYPAISFLAHANQATLVTLNGSYSSFVGAVPTGYQGWCECALP